MNNAELGKSIFTFLVNHVDEAFTRADICDQLTIDWNDFPGAIRSARHLAKKAQLHIPLATPESGFTYFVTADPNLVEDSRLHALKVEMGVARVRKGESDFIKAREDQLSTEARIRNSMLRETEEMYDSFLQFMERQVTHTWELRKVERQAEKAARAGDAA